MPKSEKFGRFDAFNCCPNFDSDSFGGFKVSPNVLIIQQQTY